MQKNEFLEQAGRYADDLRHYLMSHLKDSEAAEDLAHDCLLQAAELYGRNKYDESKPLKNWLFCMAYSRLVDYIRHQRNCRRHHSLYPDKIREALGWDIPPADTPVPLLPSSRTGRPTADFHLSAMPFRTVYVRQLLQTGFAGLPVSPAQRRLLQLRYVERLTYKQIAVRLQEPLSTVVSRHAYAMRLLRGDFAAACHRRRKRRSGYTGALC